MYKRKNNNFYLKENKCYSIGSITNCIISSYNETGSPKLKCDVCKEKFFINSKGGCSPCNNSTKLREYCLVCSENQTELSKNYCDSCIEGYFLNKNKICESCDNKEKNRENCEYCKINEGNGNYECFKCKFRYYLN